MPPLEPKKVAIIGAGASGLVTAKTLLRDFPAGTFSPTVFEARDVVGGLWPGGRTATDHITTHVKRGSGSGDTPSLNPSMRTNLSRFSVAFSDLSWESVFDGHGNVPMFPQAWQVGMYLQKYVDMYIPHTVLRLGRRVMRVVRGRNNRQKNAGWTVYSVTTGEEEEEEDFDILVVASGYFSRPYIPDIRGLSESGLKDRIIHSSALRDTDDLLPLLRTGGQSTGTKKLVVIGGSMSGVEAASTLALHLSSSRFSSLPSADLWTNCEVHHICPQPVWTLPTYLPQTVTSPDSRGKGSVSFLPLDLVMYDLCRRPAGPVEYSVGPVSSQQAAKVTEYLRSLLSMDNASLGHEKPLQDKETRIPRPPWVAISDDYTEFVRSGTISVTTGRVSAVRYSSSGLAKIELKLPDGKNTILDDVAVIVMSTGFSPFDSLSFLPPDILSTLEYSEHDIFCPVILDKGGSMHSNMPDLGFVGFYRGPYWGVMEMQARSLGQNWAREEEGTPPETELTDKRKREDERERLRALRQANPEHQRGQFPMGDYVGLMESFGRDLEISRTEIFDCDVPERKGPVIPARYPFHKNSCRASSSSTPQDIDRESQMATTLNSLRLTLSSEQNIFGPALPRAIFRALHGTWIFSRTVYRSQNGNNPSTSEKGRNRVRDITGTATFHPCYPSSEMYSKEYIYEEQGGHADPTATDTEKKNINPIRSIYRFRESIPRSEYGKNNSYISIWSTNTDKSNSPIFSHAIDFTSSLQRMEHGETIPGEYVVRARARTTAVQGDAGLGSDTYPENHDYDCDYKFLSRGVEITSWECTFTGSNGERGQDGTSRNMIHTKTFYRR
ncbi:hypothetical protein MAP00_004859 [Monascus purpureus]|nr:hypothetical protein MAP00_004859 [Monascus purpureus]